MNITIELETCIIMVFIDQWRQYAIFISKWNGMAITMTIPKLIEELRKVTNDKSGQ